MKNILQEFKQFAMRGNVIDMAVGIIIGGAFGKIVSSAVSDLIMPPIGLLIGGVNFTDLKIVLKQAVMEGENIISPAVSINYGKLSPSNFRFHYHRILHLHVGKRNQRPEQEKRRSTNYSGCSTCRYTVAYRDSGFIERQEIIISKRILELKLIKDGLLI